MQIWICLNETEGRCEECASVVDACTCEDAHEDDADPESDAVVNDGEAVR